MTAVAQPRQGTGSGGPADLPPAPVPPRATPTPVALWRVGALCAVVALLAGILVAVTAFDRAARLDDAAAKTRQLVTLTDARSQVAAADAAATAAFLKGGIEDAAGRNAYVTALDEASVSVNQAAASGIGDTDALAAVAEAIGSYRGTVEYARALNRQGLPIGAAYLRDAGTTLADDVVATLDAEIAAVSGSIRTNPSPLTVAVTVVVLLAFVAGVALTFVVLSQRTRRYVNPGVALGAGVVAVVVVAWLVMTVAVTSSVNDAVARPPARHRPARPGPGVGLRRPERREPEPHRPRVRPELRRPSRRRPGRRPPAPRRRRIRGLDGAACAGRLRSPARRRRQCRC